MGFELIHRDLVYSGRVFDLVRERYRLPDGREQTYDLVSHHGAVTILPVDDEGNVWFVRQYRFGAKESLLELPAGVLEEGEAPEATARREVQEEIGKSAARLDMLGEFFMVPGYSTEKMIAYLATGLADSSLPQDEDEFLERQAIPAREVYAMAYRGEISDGKTLASLLLAWPYLQAYLE